MAGTIIGTKFTMLPHAHVHGSEKAPTDSRTVQKHLISFVTLYIPNRFFKIQETSCYKNDPSHYNNANTSRVLLNALS